MLSLVHLLLSHQLVAHNPLPSWLLSPDWLRPPERALRRFVMAHPGPGLYLLIFSEEIGIPLPIPGDVVIMSAGYLISIGSLPYPLAVLAIIGGSINGSFLNYCLSRRYGRRFLHRFGHHFGLTAGRLSRAERSFARWGKWALIFGRLIPGTRVILSAFSGAFGVKPRTFVLSVAVSSAIWALVFLELGRQLGRRTFALFRLVPAHLLPWIVGAMAIVVIGHHLLERRRAQAEARRDPEANLLNS